jgi:hypothetical protein
MARRARQRDAAKEMFVDKFTIFTRAVDVTTGDWSIDRVSAVWLVYVVE